MSEPDKTWLAKIAEQAVRESRHLYSDKDWADMKGEAAHRKAKRLANAEAAAIESTVPAAAGRTCPRSPSL